MEYFLAFLVVFGIVMLAVYISERCTDGKKDQTKTTQNNSSIQNHFVESEFSYIKNKELRTNLEKAKFIAEKIGRTSLFQKHHDDIAKMIYIHSGKQNIIDAEIYYFVYGVHEKIEKEAAGLFFGELFTNTEFLAKVHMPVISIITDTPPKDMSPDRYSSMICDLYVAMDDDSKFLAVYDRYGYEYPERLKKLLTSDIETLAESTFYAVAMTIQSSNVKYLNKGLANLNFVLYCYSNYREAFASKGFSEEKMSLFDNLLKKYFLDYVETMKFIESREKAEEFFKLKYEKYKSINTNDDDTLVKIQEVVYYTIEILSLNESEEDTVIDEMKELLPLLTENTKLYLVKMAEEFEKQDDVSIESKDEQTSDRESPVKIWFDNIVEMITDEKNEFVNKNKYTILDYLLCEYFGYYVTFCHRGRSPEKSKNFNIEFFKRYYKYATDSLKMDKNEAENFYWNRIDKYGEILESDAEKKDEILLFNIEQFIKKSLNETPFEKAVVINDVFKSIAIRKEIGTLYGEIRDKTFDLFLDVCASYGVN